MPGRIEVSGLRQAARNFETLNEMAQKEIGRDALRTLGWALAKPMKAATYTTFLRRTGAIRDLLGVNVQQSAKDNTLTGYVEECAGRVTGTETPFKALVRKRRSSRRKRSVSIAPATAYWWRFLEFGTGPRRARRTPSFLRTGKLAKTEKRQRRQLRAASEWQASGSRGGIRSRSWLRPLFGSNAPNAIRSFRETFLKLVDAATGAMPKK
jgi:hypothetical protein